MELKNLTIKANTAELRSLSDSVRFSRMPYNQWGIFPKRKVQRPPQAPFMRSGVQPSVSHPAHAGCRKQFTGKPATSQSSVIPHLAVLWKKCWQRADKAMGYKTGQNHQSSPVDTHTYGEEEEGDL